MDADIVVVHYGEDCRSALIIDVRGDNIVDLYLVPIPDDAGLKFKNNVAKSDAPEVGRWHLHPLNEPRQRRGKRGR